MPASTLTSVSAASSGCQAWSSASVAVMKPSHCDAVFGKLPSVLWPLFAAQSWPAASKVSPYALRSPVAKMSTWQVVSALRPFLCLHRSFLSVTPAGRKPLAGSQHGAAVTPGCARSCGQVKGGSYSPHEYSPQLSRGSMPPTGVIAQSPCVAGSHAGSRASAQRTAAERSASGRDLNSFFQTLVGDPPPVWPPTARQTRPVFGSTSTSFTAWFAIARGNPVMRFSCCHAQPPPCGLRENRLTQPELMAPK